MVHLPTLNGMRKHYKDHVREYIRAHGGEYILIESGKNFDFEISFFRTRSGLDRAIKKYGGFYGPTILTERITKRYVSPETQDRRNLKSLLDKLDQFESASARSMKR